MRAWDMRPYAPQNRCVKVFTGHQHSFERNSLRCDWSPDGTKAGSCSCCCHVQHCLACSMRLLHQTVTGLNWICISLMRWVCLTCTVLSAWEFLTWQLLCSSCAAHYGLMCTAQGAIPARTDLVERACR